MMTDKHDWDLQYWGPDGPQPAARWGVECQRGIQYRDKGAPAPDGSPGQRRQLGGSRKARGMASDGLQVQERLGNAATGRGIAGNSKPETV